VAEARGWAAGTLPLTFGGRHRESEASTGDRTN